MTRQRPIEVSAQEMQHQRQCAQRAAQRLDEQGLAVRYAYLRTYGCQMNEHDSELLAGFLSLMGYELCQTPEQADLILLNTCCVRAGAEEKVYGHIGRFKHLCEEKPHLILCVCGCMMQQEGVAQALMQRFVHVKLAFGTHALCRFPELLCGVLEGADRVVDVSGDGRGVIIERAPMQRAGAVTAYANIMFGCDNFCSYCIVPYVRGRERSRRPQAILEELLRLKDRGIKEVTLLGQNVNSYGNDLEGASFAQLLRDCDEIGIERIRFMTSHPKDISEEVLEVMAHSKHICRQLHLPVQSGSDRILQAMNRHYTTQQYLDILSRARALMPELGVTTDLIVGFPGETQEDFAQTLALVQAARFDSAFTFKYSRRKGTVAYGLPEQVSAEVKKERIMQLISLQDEVTAQIHQALVGQTQEVLVDGRSKRSASAFSGKLSRGITVNIKSERDIMGQIVPVTVTTAKKNTLNAELQK